MSRAKMIKTSVNLSSDVIQVLRDLAEKRETTMTEILRQAIGTEKFIDDVKCDGGTILIEDKRGRTRQLVFR